MRILVAEDEPVTAQVLAHNLRGWGHDVDVVSTGAEAWEAHQREQYPVIVSDWEMPGMEGVELVRRVREMEDDHYAYFILLTSRSQMSDVVSGLEAGADDYLAKPVDLEELRARLRAGIRIVELKRSLAERNRQLAGANQRMSQDLEAAAAIQRAMLPVLIPSFPGVRFSWNYRPCDELAGDILNVFRLNEQYCGFYLLDVSGHGVPAALLSVTLGRVLVPSVVSSTVLTRLGEDGVTVVPPAVMLRRLNRRFLGGPATGQFFTLLYGVVDLETRELHYASAGHPGPIIVDQNGRTQTLEATGPPLGIMDGLSYEQATVQLEPGQRVLIYSDGLTEARAPDGELFGATRLAQLWSTSRNLGLDEVLPLVLETLERWRGADDFSDDVSCLGFEVTA